MLVTSDRRYAFGVGPDELWDAFTRVDDYQRWWPWLRRFEGGRIGPGQRWSCTVHPPLPYSLRFDLLLDEVCVGHHVTADVSGDITGRARVDITPTHEGSELRLVSQLAPSSTTLRTISRFARPVATFGHDWVLDTGFRQFATRGLATEAAETRRR